MPYRSVVDPTLAKIATCESQGDFGAVNPTSGASGKYQFLVSSWEGYGKQLWGTTTGKSIFSEKDQDDLAVFIYAREGGTPWNASRSCWDT